MSDCIPPELIQRFVAGEVGEYVAVQIAEHLDACPHCARRAAAADDLVAVFAGIPSPAVPPDLVHNALRTARPESAAPPKTPQVITGASLLMAAVVVGLLLAADAASVDASLAAQVERSVRHVVRVSEPFAALGWALALGVAALAAGLRAGLRTRARFAP